MIKRRRGFSLLELMVVVGILGLLLAIGVPNYINYRSNQTLRTTVDTLVGEARLARQTARENGDGVTFAGTIPSASAANGNVDVSVYEVVNGQVSDRVGNTTVSSEFAPGGKNLLLPTDVTGAQVPLGALVVFTGPRGVQVLAFQQNGSIVLTGNNQLAAVALVNKTLDIEMLMSGAGDVRSFQVGNTGASLAEQTVVQQSSVQF